MITRYTPSSYGSMSEKENGEYVKYSDYEELLKDASDILLNSNADKIQLSVNKILRRIEGE